MKKYVKYKKTDLPWLAEVPSEWIVKRAKALFTEIKDIVGDRHSEYTLLSLTKQGVIVRDLVNKRGKFPKDFNTYKAVNTGQMVFCLFDFEETPRTVGLAKNDGMITGAYTIFDINGANSDYLDYYYCSLDDTKHLMVLATGLRKTINIDTLLSSKHPLPSRTEQDKIVEFLDWKTSKINHFINEKKKQIKLLDELRKVTIAKAISHGLDDNVEKRENIRIINLIETVKSGAWGDYEDICCVNIACVRVADFDFERLCIKDVPFTIRSYEQSVVDKLLLRNGDILIEKSGGGDKQTVGRAVLFNKSIPALYANFIEAIRVNKRVIPAYLTYTLASQYYLEKNKFHYNQTIGIQNLDVKGYLREFILLPTLEKQKSIVAYLDKQCGRIDKIIGKLHEEIALFIEYRTRLISDVVTGQIDVRNIAIPDYIKEIEDIDDEIETTNEEAEENA
jgi:type I restriction enzyme S subunit